MLSHPHQILPPAGPLRASGSRWRFLWERLRVPGAGCQSGLPWQPGRCACRVERDLVCPPLERDGVFLGPAHLASWRLVRAVVGCLLEASGPVSSTPVWPASGWGGSWAAGQRRPPALRPGAGVRGAWGADTGLGLSRFPGAGGFSCHHPPLGFLTRPRPRRLPRCLLARNTGLRAEA